MIDLKSGAWDTKSQSVTLCWFWVAPVRLINLIGTRMLVPSWEHRRAFPRLKLCWQRGWCTSAYIGAGCLPFPWKQRRAYFRLKQLIHLSSILATVQTSEVKPGITSMVIPPHWHSSSSSSVRALVLKEVTPDLTTMVRSGPQRRCNPDGMSVWRLTEVVGAARCWRTLWRPSTDRVSRVAHSSWTTRPSPCQLSP